MMSGILVRENRGATYKEQHMIQDVPYACDIALHEQVTIAVTQESVEEGL